MRLPVYLDNHATTPVDPRVVEAMLPYFSERFGNAASKTHSFGWEAAQAVEEARQEVAQLIGARPSEVIFTSGATEANNLAILGSAETRQGRGGHLVTSRIEHRAVIDPCRHLEKRGFQVTWLEPGRDGRILPSQVERVLREDTILVTIMHGNNEIGSLNPIAEIGAVVRSRGIPFHCDAAQSVGRIPVHVDRDQVDLLSLSGHKIYAPKGIGALYVRQRPPALRISPVLHGGGHERGLRPGTLSVPLVVALGAACRICRQEMNRESDQITRLARGLRDGLLELPGVALNGHPEERLPGNVNVSFPGIEAEALLMGLPDVALSSGSACTSARVEPSHVLRGIGLSSARAQGSVRFGVGRFNHEDEIDYALERVRTVVTRLTATRGSPGSRRHSTS